MRFHVTWHQANANAILRNKAITFCGSRASLAGFWSSGGNNGSRIRVPSRGWNFILVADVWLGLRNMSVRFFCRKAAQSARDGAKSVIKWDSCSLGVV